jgi:4-hydroxy-3-methylbut-2-en-1-yl diphosphate reductase
MAEHYGMCFGVRDAIALAFDLARQGPLTILGDLVHNPDVVVELDRAGARRASHPDQVRTNSVLLTAHGTAKRTRLELEENGHRVHDAVCPLVTRVHLALAKLIAEERHPVIIGKADHVEVRGLVGDLSQYTIVLSEADLGQLAGKQRLGVVAQTTQPLDRVLDLVKAMRRRYPRADVRFIDTVCQPTKERQEALRRLIRECEAIVVVGGAESNNSRKLAELARHMGRPAYQVARASELRKEWFKGFRRVGLTAGTSTPEHIILEVREALEEMPTEQEIHLGGDLIGPRAVGQLGRALPVTLE